MFFNGNVTAALGRGLAASLGRKGTESDVTLYNHKHNDTVLSFVEPSAYPDKVQSLVSALNIADQVLLKVDEINETFGELVVALDACGLKMGHLILGESIPLESIKPLIKDSILSSYSIADEQVVALRETLSKLILPSEGEPIVQVDHCFQVKGVGTVALGVVKKGVLRKHDNVFIYPSKTETLVKSIQVHDTDVSEARAGVRVGIALKDVKPGQVDRGSILSTRGDLKTASTLESNASISRYARTPLVEGDQVMVNSNLNYTPGKITSSGLKPGETGRLTVELEKEIPVVSERILLLDPSRRIPRVLGYLIQEQTV
ncbi:MAG: EF-Tu/IF-2/RF-3 family GTPase [Candidatus Altiarchaeota archaeon]